MKESSSYKIFTTFMLSPGYFGDVVLVKIHHGPSISCLVARKSSKVALFTKTDQGLESVANHITQAISVTQALSSPIWEDPGIYVLVPTNSLVEDLGKKATLRPSCVSETTVRSMGSCRPTPLSLLLRPSRTCPKQWGDHIAMHFLSPSFYSILWGA